MPYQRWEPPSTCHCGGGEALGVCHHGRGEADPHGLRTHRGGFLTFFHITVAVEKKGHPSSGQRHERHRLQSEGVEEEEEEEERRKKKKKKWTCLQGVRPGSETSENIQHF